MRRGRQGPAPAEAARIDVHIDEIVIHGFELAPSDSVRQSVHEAVRAAVEQAVGAAVAASSTDGATAGGLGSSLVPRHFVSRFHSVNALDAGTITLPPAQGPRPDGAAVGGAIGRSAGAAIGSVLTNGK